MSNRNRKRKSNHTITNRPVVPVFEVDLRKEAEISGRREAPGRGGANERPEPDAEQMLILQEEDKEEKEPETVTAENTEVSEEIPEEGSEEIPAEVNTETAAEEPAEIFAENPEEKPEEKPAEEPGEGSAAKGSAEVSAEEPAEDITGNPASEVHEDPVKEPAEEDSAGSEEQSAGPEEEQEDAAVKNPQPDIPAIPDLKIENVPQFYIDDDDEEEMPETGGSGKEGREKISENSGEAGEQTEEKRRPRRKPRQEIEVRPEPRRKEPRKKPVPPKRKSEIPVTPKAEKPRKPVKTREAEKPVRVRQDKRETGKIGNKSFNILFVSEGKQRVRTIRTTTDIVILVSVIAASLIIAMIAYVVHGLVVREEFNRQIEERDESITTLSEDTIILQAEIERLEDELKAAQDKISAKENRAQAKTEAEALLFIPSALPLDSQALPSEYDRKNKWITLDAAPGVHVVATGDGKVEYSGESVEAGGYLVTVDHGNGYKSNYYCQSKPVVKEGEKVSRGTALFAIGENADKLIYRIIYEDDFIDPYTVLNISG